MSELCTKCADKYNQPIGIDVEKIFENLQEGETESGFYCESCGLIAITRNDNNLQVMRSKDDKLVNWENY